MTKLLNVFRTSVMEEIKRLLMGWWRSLRMLKVSHCWIIL